MSTDTTEVIFYSERNVAPALVWLDDQPLKVRLKFVRLIELLVHHGSRLSRPHAAPLRDKVYELRVRHLNVNYRLLYFFYGKAVAVIGHGCSKQREVDHADIEKAVARREKFIANPNAHRHVFA